MCRSVLLGRVQRTRYIALHAWRIGILQAADVCERPQTLIFGKATRDDIGKLFLGKDAVAYITRRTPGPGTHELGWQRPCSLFPSRYPGTSIGGPLANVDRVQTGPLGVAYKSLTPGPGAYDSENNYGGGASSSRYAPLTRRRGGTAVTPLFRVRASSPRSLPTAETTENVSLIRL